MVQGTNGKLPSLSSFAQGTIYLSALSFSFMLSFTLHLSSCRPTTLPLVQTHLLFLPPSNLQETESSDVGPESTEGHVYQEPQTTRHLPGDSSTQLQEYADASFNKSGLQGDLLVMIIGRNEAGGQWESIENVCVCTTTPQHLHRQ